MVHRPSVGCPPWSPTSSACGCPTAPVRWGRSPAASAPSGARSSASTSSSGAAAGPSTSWWSSCPSRASQDLLVQEIQQVDGVDVEEIRPVADALHDPRLDALETAAILVGATDRDELIQAVVVARPPGGRAPSGPRWSQLDDGDVLAAEGPVPAAGVAGRPSWRAASRRPGWPRARPGPTTWCGRRCRRPASPSSSGATAPPTGPGSAGRWPRWPASSTPGSARSSATRRIAQPPVRARRRTR